MSSYVVLARKWRPAQFSEIVGQSHVVRTFMNAIRSERIHQAYLFTGSRGIGKTSIARIFSKAIRCENTSWDGTWLNSCDECASCKEITSGMSMDVIEIDGASNNGVDAVREIRENAKFLPSTGKRKIYIIDEVHMLSTAAFNALLKTLEEPPPHVIFIFATTEPHKIPATILSRCQRFDFKRVTVAQIQERLAEISKAEGVTAEPGALALIARAAEGSMRDALSILDQVIAFSGNEISAVSVRDSIGLIESQFVLDLAEAILARDPKKAITLLDQAHQQGHDLKILNRSLIEAFHAIILAQVGYSDTRNFELSEEEWKHIQRISTLRPIEEVELMFQVLNQGIDWIARSQQPKVVLDVLVVKCATAEVLVPIEALSINSESAPAKAAPTTITNAPVATAKPTQTQSTPIASPASTVAPAPTTALAAHSTTNSSVEKSWENFILFVKKQRPLLATILEHGHCPLLPKAGVGTLTIQFKKEDDYYRQQLGAKAYDEQLKLLAKEFFEVSVQIQLEAVDHMESLAEKRQRDLDLRRQQAREQVRNNPIIREAQSLFGGELGPIELTEVNPETENHART